MKDKFDALVEHLLNGNIFMQEATEILERNMIDGALERHAGNHSAAAKLLGIHRNTLRRKITEYGLSTGRTRSRRKTVARESLARRRKTGAA